jgi:hypothetical protein
VVPDEIERSNAVVIAGDSFAIDNAGARAQACQCLDDQREAMGEIVARTAIEPHSLAILAGDDAEAVMLDLVQPSVAGRQRVGFGGEARRDECCAMRALPITRCSTDLSAFARAIFFDPRGMFATFCYFFGPTFDFPMRRRRAQSAD